MAISDETIPMIGGRIFGLVTVGMYTDPLAIYREYIQNAADSFAASGSTINGRVDIDFDLARRLVRIRDNGPGLSPDDATGRLLPVAHSQKRAESDRGFRGIGRLSGLAFAETVTFTTRTRTDQSVTRIVWHSDRLLQESALKMPTEQTIRDCVDIEILKGDDYPEHFFEVEVSGVARHAAGLILNRKAVRAYISEVCPVPLSRRFPFVSEIEELFGDGEVPLALDITLDGELKSIERQYDESIPISGNREDDFAEFEGFHIPSADGDGEAAVGWFAHSSYFGAIPKGSRVRGLRARVGNIQIGDERVFDPLFPEERFNRWCVGEVHILDPRIVPNARRDYFEPGPHLRNLENQLGPILRGIAARCRTASIARNRVARASSSIDDLEDTYHLAASGFLASEDANALVLDALSRIQAVRESVCSTKSDNGNIRRLDVLDRKLRTFDIEKVTFPREGIPLEELSAYQKVFGALAAMSSSRRSTLEVIQTLLTKQ